MLVVRQKRDAGQPRGLVLGPRSFVKLGRVELSMANPEFTDIYDEIRDERQRQDAKHGGAEHDDAHTVNDFVAFISKHAGRCVDAELHEVRDHMIRVAALAVAVVQKVDRDRQSA